MAASKFFAVTKPTDHRGRESERSVAQKTWLDKLPKNVGDEAMKTGRNLEIWVGRTATCYIERAERLCKDNGGEILRLPAQDQAEMMKRLVPLGDEFLASDPATKDMHALLKKVLARVSTEAPK